MAVPIVDVLTSISFPPNKLLVLLCHLLTVVLHCPPKASHESGVEEDFMRRREAIIGR